MPDSIYIGVTGGLTTNPLPFNIDNESFPNMYNFYSWRKRVKKKRGTLFLGRATYQIKRVLNATPPTVYEYGQLRLTADAGNLFVGVVTNVINGTTTQIVFKGHIFNIGDIVTVSGVLGSTGVNGERTVVVKNANSITVNYDSSLDPPYTTGGQVIFTFETPSVKVGSIDVTVGVNAYTDDPMDGTLLKNGLPDPGSTINYATGAIVIAGGGAGDLIGTYDVYPLLPAMGARDISITPNTVNYAALMAFDQSYSYQTNQASSNANFFVTSFYKNTNIPFKWSGQDYQQFNSTNYQGAFWATNGKPGFHFVNATYDAGSGTANIDFTFLKGGVPYKNLIVGDVLWFNEWTGGSTLNGVTGTVSVIIDATLGQYTVAFSAAVTVIGSAIAQLLTNSIIGQDGIKWYDGDPTNGTGIPQVNGKGWVNFAPPLTATSVSIDNLNTGTYYLVGALIIVPFKDRLLCFNPTIATSSGAQFNLDDGVIWSQNGTPYYTVDKSGTASLIPNGQTSQLTAWYVDQTGLGGWRVAGINNVLKTVGTNEDALIVGFDGDGRKARFVYTGDDFDPFLFFSISSELPSSSTFSSISLDQGVIDIGGYGIAVTDQQSTRRVDLQIPDSIFQIQNANNGTSRVSGIRDFFREWIYFCYPLNTSNSGTTANISYTFPTQTLMYNYRDNTWAYFYENFTCQGYYRPSLKKTWATLPFKTWASWREPWNSGTGSVLFPNVIAGTPQGFFLVKSQGTNEAQTCAIFSISSAGGKSQINSPNHCVSAVNPNTGDGDYLLFDNVLGLKTFAITGITNANPCVLTCTSSLLLNKDTTISGVVGMTELNGNTYTIIAKTSTHITINVDSTNFTPYESGGFATSAFNNLVGKVIKVIDEDNFVVDIKSPQFVTEYLGNGSFAKLCQPLLQTKQFPVYWDQGRQVRLCAQKYLMDNTDSSQCTVQIYLSQDPDLPYSSAARVPPPNALIYSELLYTCPESTNIGLTPANTNLQMPTAEGQFQIWHRSNTSLIGDSVQIGITLSDAQMRNLVYAQSEITLHGMVLVTQPGPHLA